MYISSPFPIDPRSYRQAMQFITCDNNIGAVSNLNFASSAIMSASHRNVGRGLVKDVDAPSQDYIRILSARCASSDRELNRLTGLRRACPIVLVHSPTSKEETSISSLRYAYR